jgi:hypothetical protein
VSGDSERINGHRSAHDPPACVSAGAKESGLMIFSNGEVKMLELIAVLLIVMWLLGMVSSYTLGGFIHLLLVLAIVTVLIRVIQGRRAL